MKKYNATWQRFLVFAVAVVAAGWTSVARAQPAVESITGSIQGGTEVVRIDFSQPLPAVPSGFAIQAPARSSLSRSEHTPTARLASGT